MIRRRRFGIGSGGIGIGSGSSGQQLGEKALLASEAAKERGRSRAGPLGGERGLELLSNVWVNIWCWVDGEEALLVCPYPILPIEIGNNALQRSEKGIWREIRNTLLNFSLETLMILTHNNTIKAGGSTVRAQNVWVGEWSGVDGYPLDCYDY